MVIPVAGGVLGGMVAAEIKSPSYQKAAILLTCLFAICLTWPYMKPSRWLSENEVKNYSYADSIYFPKNVTKIPDKASKYEIKKGKGALEQESVKDHEIIYKIIAENPIQLTVNTHFFPGWNAYLDGKKIGLSEEKDFGFMDVSIPEGKHRFILRFEDTGIRKFGNILTLSGLLILILWSIQNQIIQINGGRKNNA